MSSILQLKNNNLYVNGIIVDYQDGEFSLERTNIYNKPTELDKYHVVKEFDRLDLIAYQYYKSIVKDASKYWWVIADANVIDNPLDLSDWVGKELVIPDLTKIKLDL